MFKRFKETQKLNETLFLLLLSAFSLSVLFVRIYYAKNYAFAFLIWNLFLAAVPWIISTFFILFPKIQKKKLILIPGLGLWLMFFPNSPYILTDLFHLRLNLSMPIWFDLVLILSFAWAGLMFGFKSLLDIEKILSQYFKKHTIFIFTALILFLSAFGIYLGRFLRWNSWDIIQEPVNLIYDVADKFVNPFNHPRTWGVTILLGVFLNLAFWSFKYFNQSNKKQHYFNSSKKI